MVRIQIEHKGQTVAMDVNPNQASVDLIADTLLGLVFPDLFEVRMKIARAGLIALAEVGK